MNKFLSATQCIPLISFRRSFPVKFHRKRHSVVKNKLSLPLRKNFSQESSKNIVHSPLGEVNVPNILFHEFLFQNWSLWEGKTAMECGKTGRKYTYEKVREYSKAFAAALQNKFGLNKGNIIAVVLQNCPEYPIVVLASSQIGVVSTTINPNYTVDEITWQMQDSGAKLMVAEASMYKKCVEVTQAMKTSLPIVLLRTDSDDKIPEGGVDLFGLFKQFASHTLKPVDISFEDNLILPYSSGTTGTPKGVILSHRNLVSNLTQISHPETMLMNPTTIKYSKYSRHVNMPKTARFMCYMSLPAGFHQDTILGILPMFHIYGLIITTFYSLKDGCRVLSLPRFNPKLYMQSIVQKKVNILYVVPQILNFLTRDEIRPKYFKTLSYVINAAAPLSLKDAHLILEKAEHVKIAQGYGMTEASPALSHSHTKRMQKLTSIGVPIASTKMKIINVETGEALPKGEHGELCAWGPQVMKGYLNRPEDSKDAFDGEGWLRTGDIAYYDDDNDFYIVERLKELIKVKGFQVAPAELEEVLRTHPKIKDAAVVGVNDPDYGEVPKAFIIIKDGSTMTEEEVKAFISRKLSSYKHLRGGVKFVDNIPRNNVGKVLRKVLKNLS